MPRKARLDAPGTLHHIIIRRIERNKIVDMEALRSVSRRRTVSRARAQLSITLVE